MVHKTSHRGVHSGNTLRAFNSRFSRRYHNQSCIVSRVHPELLQKLMTGNCSSKADAASGEKAFQNIAVDVALSLNKQSRWLLPSALIRQIKNDDIAESALTVSLLERHKLKRPANCISFHSNKGEVKRIQPRDGRYFPFKYLPVDGKSRRALRRERRELGKGEKNDNNVVVFTEQGQVSRYSDLSESEVRYEVYYPSPSQSSISHNPKYIKQDVDVSPGYSNEHVLHGKPKKQHRGKQRKRMSMKDVDDCDLPSYRSHLDQSLTAITNSAGYEESPAIDHLKEEQSATECLLSSLIEKAQQLQNFKGMAKSRKKKTEKNCSHHMDDKSHIVYINEPQVDSLSSTKSDNSPPSIPPIPSESTRVLLLKDDVTVESLKDLFGEDYFDAGCKPRKFVLDITPNVRELLKKEGVQAKIAERTDDALSYLICAHDGFYDDEYDVYKVLLNSKLHQGLLAVQINTEGDQDMYRGTLMNLISKTMDFIQGIVTTFKDNNHIPMFVTNTPVKAPERHLSRHLGSSEVYVPSVQRMFRTGSAISDISLPTLSDMLQEDPIFCDVCYGDISPMTMDSAPSTSLLTCKHSVCDSCWSQHIHIRLHEGFVRLTCPGYDCQEEVKVGVLLSVAALDTVDKLLQRQEEVRVGASSTEKWCPNESCGRVISVQPSSFSRELPFQQDVVCACGTHVCFQCLSPAHWPASCKQAEDYRLNLVTAVFPDRMAEVHDDNLVAAKLAQERETKKTMLVEGKHCPSCKRFAFKDGGCPQMICSCGQLFCWHCTKLGSSHHNRSCVNEKEEKRLTTTITVHHLEANKKEHQQSVNRRQRMSLMERAVEHRHNRQSHKVSNHAVDTFAKSVARAAAKNQVLAQRIVKVCSEAFPSSSTSSKTRSPTDTRELHAAQTSTPLLETVTTFIKNASHSKQELHEVVEYSLVLLKDLPDSLFRQRALRVSEDLGAFCSFSQSIFDVWGGRESPSGNYQEAVKAVMRLAEIQGWVQSSLDVHVATVRRLRSLSSPISN